MIDILPFVSPVVIGLISLTRSVVYLWYLRRLFSDSPAAAIEITMVWDRPPTLTVRRLPHPGSRP